MLVLSINLKISIVMHSVDHGSYLPLNVLCMCVLIYNILCLSSVYDVWISLYACTLQITHLPFMIYITVCSTFFGRMLFHLIVHIAYIVVVEGNIRLLAFLRPRGWGVGKSATNDSIGSWWQRLYTYSLISSY